MRQRLVLFHIISPRPECVNKDLAGGMGTATTVGYSLLGRLIQWMKKESVRLPVMTTGYLAGLGKQLGWKVKVVTTHGHKHNLGQLKADLALVPVSIVDNKNELEIIRKLKRKGITVGVYGTFASTVPEYFVNEADFVIKGEAEAALIKITKTGKVPKGIFDVGSVEDVDSLPFPDWDQFDVSWFSYSPSLNVKPLLPILSSRGCPYSCFFYCPYPITLGRRWRARSPKNVVDEIEYLIRRYDAKALDFRDAVFSLQRDRTIQLAEELIRRRIKIAWSCETRLDRLDEELIDLLYEAGLKNINCGVESASDKVLRSSNRLPIAHRHQEKIIRHAQSRGMTVAAFYIIGLVSDTPASVRASIEYAKKLNTNVGQFTIATPYPGTQFYEQLKSEGKIYSDDWQEFDQYTPTYEHPGLTSEEMLHLKEQAFVEYYFRPAWLIKHLPKYLTEKYLRF